MAAEDRAASPPTAEPPLRLGTRGWLLIAGAWTLVGLLAISQEAVCTMHVQGSVPWLPLLRWHAFEWSTSGLATPLLLRLVQRWPLSLRGGGRALPLYLAAVVAFVMGKYLLLLAVGFRPPLFDGRFTLGSLVADNFFGEVIAFVGVVALLHGLRLYEQERRQALHTSQLAAALHAARLDALTAQLHPHFLFNTLNGVATLMHHDPAAADQMLTHLAELLRATLERAPTHEVTLREELRLLDRYLEIMRVRYGERLHIDVDASAAPLEAMVPRFVLQPLVENALTHGIQRHAGAGHVSVRARGLAAELEIVVADDGPGPGAPRDGLGLFNTRRRLEQLYGGAQRLTLESCPGAGAQVTMRLPLRRAAGLASS